MLIIAHRGSRGTHPENTIAALREGIASGADMVEFDVRLTRDGELVLFHDFHLYRTHKQMNIIRTLTLAELQKRTAGSAYPIVTLRQALKECGDKILINIEVKDRGSGKKTIELVMSEYKNSLKNIMISSFSARELLAVRKKSKKIALSYLQHINPFAFLAFERSLHLSAVGFHRLHAPQLAIAAAQKLDMLTYAYTVNRLNAIKQLESKGIDAVVTDYPRKFAKKQSRA